MAKKERLSEFNKGNILSAAKTLFHEKGIVQTTVDEIAKKADYSKSTIYIYFNGKDDIYNHLLLEHIQIQKKMIIEALQKSPGFPEGYFAICNAMARFYEANPLYFEGILGEIEIRQDDSEAILAQIYNEGEEINKIIENYLKECVDEHNVSIGTTLRQTAFTLWASVSGIITLANKKKVYLRKEMDVSKERFMHDGFVMLLKTIKGDFCYEKQ